MDFFPKGHVGQKVKHLEDGVRSFSQLKSGVSVGLNDRYRLIEEIAKGAYGVVFLSEDKRHAEIASQTLSKRLRAIKFVKSDDVQKNEIGILQRISDSQFVARCFDFFACSEFEAIVMEYCPETLVDFIEKLHRGEDIPEPLRAETALDMFYYFAEGVAYIHRKNIIHRDLKPSNVLVKNGFAKIGDFGESRRISSTDLASTVRGSPLYMSPEVIEGLLVGSKFTDTYYNQSSDIWSVGCIYYELLTGNPAFVATSLKELGEKITEGKIPTVASIGVDYENLLTSLMTVNPDIRMKAEAITPHKLFKALKKKWKTVLMIGGTGSGKSNLGNTLVGASEVFITSANMYSETKAHSAYRMNVEHISLIDTMGSNDTEERDEVVKARLVEALSNIIDGVDVILFCMPAVRLTNDHVKSYDFMVKMLGEKCCQNVIIVLTQGENVMANKTAEEQQQWIRQQAASIPAFAKMWNACGKRVCLIDNPNPKEHPANPAKDKLRKEAREKVLKSISELKSPRVYFEISRNVTVRSEVQRLADEFAANARIKSEGRGGYSPRETGKAIQTPAEKEEPKRDADMSEAFRLVKKAAAAQRLSRMQAHEYFCIRKTCHLWKSLYSKEQNLSLDDLLQQHIPGCNKCKTCEMCMLELRFDKLSNDELVKLQRCFADELSGIGRGKGSDTDYPSESNVDSSNNELKKTNQKDACSLQ